MRDTAFPTVETAGPNFKDVDYSDTKHLPIQWRVFHAIVSGLVFTPFRTSLRPIDDLRTPNPTAPTAGGGQDDPGRPLSTAFFVTTKIMIFFLSFVAATLVYLLAIYSAFQHSLFRPDHFRPIDSPAFENMIWVMTVAFILLGGPLLAVCIKSWSFEKNTGTMILEYYAELKTALDRVILHQVVTVPAAAPSYSATAGDGVGGRPGASPVAPSGLG